MDWGRACLQAGWLGNMPIMARKPHPALPYRGSSLLWPPLPANNPNSIHLLPSSCGLVDATSPILHLRRSSICAPPTKPSRLSYFSRRTARASPPPPPSEDPNTIAGIQATLSRIQDRLRIFFAVFFWMSLFFWGSAWDGRNDARKKKGPPWFRK